MKKDVEKKPVDVYVCVKCGRQEDHFRNTCPRCGATMVKRTKIVEIKPNETPKP